MKTRRITLETHLHKIAEYDETVKNLESVFNIQKQKVIRYIGSVVTSFPTYSTHDAVHSMNIISAIEKILGQKTIKKMSGIDTFLILMCAYMHDTGMLYSDEEVKQLWETEGFQDFLTSARKREDEVGRAARKIDKAEKGEGCSVLEVRRSVAVILMEYFRPRHGQRIKHVTDARTSEFGSLLSIDDSFLPDRIIHNIYRISMAHNWSFEDILKEMPLADSFGVEEFHPRMVAYLIRMGDLCDMDNNRFNGVGIKVFGNLGEENLAHYFKHKSVETLHISSDGIVVVANVCYDMIQRECEENWLKHMEKAERDSALKNIFQNTVKEHINWKSWLEQEVTAGKMHSMELFPEKKFISVPELKYKILIDGEESESTHKNLKFLFSSEKAFKLIEDISIYQNNKLIFVRELIQNALDATKMQLYRTLSAYGFQFNEKTSPFDVERAYPNIFEEHAIMIHTDYSRETGKVYFSIRDKGIGISMDEFKRNILTTGRSWPERKEYQDEIKRMPEWLRPTGAFGIGLHTVFSVTDSLTIRTKSDSENKANEMTLYSGKKGGYAFCKKTNQTLQRGSEFSFSFLLTEELKEWVTGSNGGKMDWNGMHGESFQQSYFDQQMRTLLWHFLQIAGIGFSYVAFEKVNFDDNEKNTLFEYKNLITQKSFQFYQKAFPFCSQWKFTKDMYQCVEESAISGLIRWRPEFRNRVPDFIRWKYCLPNSALDKVFVEWRAEHCFSNVKPLEIFLRFSGIPEIVLDIPGENCPIGEKEKKVWRKFCTESYLNWKLFYRIRPLSEVAKDMLNKETIVLRRPFTTYISELFPVFHRMSLVSMDERRMEFSIHNSNTHGVQIDSQTKKRIFKEFWKEVERSHDPKGYVAMIGMEEYPMLGIENAEEQYHAQIGMLAKYPEIPLWDYGAGIKAFMDQFIGCPIDEKSQEIIDRIINSEGGKAVIHYIAVYRKKTGDDVKEEKIETQYREFLKELIYCWADGRCTFG